MRSPGAHIGGELADLEPMSATDSLKGRFIRIALIVSTLIYGFGFWVNRDRAFTDFRVLHLGSDLIAAGRANEAYDAATFSALAADHPQLGASARELDVFISPPPFAIAMRPLSVLSSNDALLLWMALGVLGLVGAVRLLRLPWWSSIIALVALPFGVANIYHAQTGFLAVLWVAAIHRLSVDDRPVAAGVVAGLAVLKPTLLLGVALWWLLDWRRWYPALLSAFGVGSAIVLATVVGGFEQWRLFFDALAFRASLDQEVVTNQPTIGEAVSRVAGTGIGAHPLAQLMYVAVGGVAMLVALRRWRGDTAVLSGFAMLVSILISPHMLIYDTGLVIVPAAVLLTRGIAVDAMERWTLIYTFSSLITIMSIGWLQVLNDWVMPGTVGVIMLSVMWAKLIDADAARQSVVLTRISADQCGLDGDGDSNGIAQAA